MAPKRLVTGREAEILRLMADGLTDRQIAERLGLGRRTVSNHVSTTLLKLEATRRTDAVAKAIHLRLL
jgi:DNA-binding NarL/FixJ family response regulator